MPFLILHHVKTETGLYEEGSILDAEGRPIEVAP
ncbi:hypothetical protein COLO4_32567 [Corchorus olitorius]|uniref:Uncharacterized protein n=1 Tax=Corchorus olitorius TaxID=93759 RepID=A0A1R3GZ19_9ROSI|nr:hypothetical protein COLO4_32567 [Corchorus olitorius]